MDRLLAGARRVEVDVLGDVATTGSRLISPAWRPPNSMATTLLAGRTGSSRREGLDRALDPGRGRLLEVEVAIDPLDGAGGAERGEAGVDRLADGAELGIGGVAERQYAVSDAVEPGRRRATSARHSHGRTRAGGSPSPQVAATTMRRRLRARCARSRSAKSIICGSESALAGELRGVLGEALGVAGFAREQDGERLRRAGPAAGWRRAPSRRRRRPRGSPRARLAGPGRRRLTPYRGSRVPLLRRARCGAGGRSWPSAQCRRRRPANQQECSFYRTPGRRIGALRRVRSGEGSSSVAAPLTLRLPGGRCEPATRVWRHRSRRPGGEAPSSL